MDLLGWILTVLTDCFSNILFRFYQVGFFKNKYKEKLEKAKIEEGVPLNT